MPAVAAATAAVVRTFFGAARRRTMRETDTENLFFGDRGVLAARAARTCRGAETLGGTSAPCDVIQRNRLGNHPQ
ncbi:hypothetical protein GCM10018783_46070 [Streptomyces griseosporeus]|nr:hypothetical protein GCM10018783_46070 [Streptomyces griseosporeus]